MGLLDEAIDFARHETGVDEVEVKPSYLKGSLLCQVRDTLSSHWPRERIIAVALQAGQSYYEVPAGVRHVVEFERRLGVEASSEAPTMSLEGFGSFRFNQPGSASFLPTPELQAAHAAIFSAPIELEDVFIEGDRMVVEPTPTEGLNLNVIVEMGWDFSATFTATGDGSQTEFVLPQYDAFNIDVKVAGLVVPNRLWDLVEGAGGFAAIRLKNQPADGAEVEISYEHPDSYETIPSYLHEAFRLLIAAHVARGGALARGRFRGIEIGQDNLYLTNAALRELAKTLHNRAINSYPHGALRIQQ